MPDLEDVVKALINNAGHARTAWPPEDSVLVEEWLEEWEESKPPTVATSKGTTKGATK